MHTQPGEVKVPRGTFLFLKARDPPGGKSKTSCFTAEKLGGGEFVMELKADYDNGRYVSMITTQTMRNECSNNR